MKYGLLVKCKDCNTDFEINKYTYKKKIESNESIYCKECRFKGDRNPNHGKIKSKKKIKLLLTCEECNKEFEMSQERIELRYEKYNQHLCRSCSRIGDRNPFYGQQFSEEKKEELSQIRKEYYNDDEFGEQRRFIQSEKFSGENNPMYKGAELKSDYTWRNKTYRGKILHKFNYTCEKCNQVFEEKDLIAHHKDSADWCIDGRNDLNNGSCLCVECHKRFHSKYGYGNNTKYQYDLFLKKCSETIES